MESKFIHKGGLIYYLTAAFFIILVIISIPGCAGKKAPAEMDQPYFAQFSKGDVSFEGEFQVVAFNIERGVHLQEVIRYLKQLKEEQPATIFLLPECDRDHSRSEDKFIAREIAKALKMDMVFVVEYIEYNDKTKENQATHGNAILSPFPLSDISVIRHTPVFSWDRYGWIFAQPRDGGQVALGATVNLPDGQKLRTYCLHLESIALGVQNKIQIMDVLPEADSFDMPLVLAGDLNTNPGSALFEATEDYQIQNAFQGDKTPTGWCFFPDTKNNSLKCIFKIDWILYRDLELIDRGAQSLLADHGGRVSDHAAVRAIFRMK
jgi:endonuclease/exonuclease/phosphatase family metal-dependent hydrolase